MADIEREQRNQEATVHVGNLDSLVTEELLWELFTQAGPLERIHIPRDKITGEAAGYGFVEFCLERDAEYASRLLSGVRLYNRPLKVNRATATSKALDVGANLFVGGLDEQADESMLRDVFSAFGTLIKAPQIARDLATGNSLGYAFISYDNFRSSDLAIETMNEQFLFNKQIRVMYAFKKRTTERHGSEIERSLADSQTSQQQNGRTDNFGPTGANLIPVAPASSLFMAPPPPPLQVMPFGFAHNHAPLLAGHAPIPPMMMMAPPPPPPPPMMNRRG